MAGSARTQVRWNAYEATVSVYRVDASVCVRDQHLGYEQFLHSEHHTVLHSQAHSGADLCEPPQPVSLGWT